MNIQLIAETAWHHDGDYKYMLNLVRQIAGSEADIVKFHLLLDGEEYYHKDVLKSIDLNSKLFSKEQWNDFFNIANNAGKNIMLLLNDIKSVEFGIRYNPDLVEIHSVALNDIHLLNALKNNIRKDSKIVLGVGGSTLEEIDNALNVLQHNNIVLMFGFQNYPTNYADINFTKMRKIMNLYPMFEFGYADHTAWNEPDNILITILGASQGMHYIEKHVTSTYGTERVDWQASISIEMLNEIAAKLNLLQECEGNGDLALSEAEKKYTVPGIMKKTAFLNTNAKTGDILTPDMICFKRTNKPSELTQLDAIAMIGRKFNRDLEKDTMLDKQYFEKQ